MDKPRTRGVDLLEIKRHKPVQKDPASVSQRDATDGKGHPHPGSVIVFPDGQRLDIHYGQDPRSVINGLLMPEVLSAIRDYLKVYQAPNSPMACRETAMVITKLDEAILWTQARQIDRHDRGVRFQDRP